MQPEAVRDIVPVMIAAVFRGALASSFIPSRQGWLCAAAGVGAFGLLTLWLLALGRPLVCTCGTVQLWAPAQDSQQLADWYSLLHVTFGMGLFILVRRFQPDWPLSRMTLTALMGSVAWEAIENLPAVIALFNPPPGGGEAYGGDTVLNAIGDSLFVVGGALLASCTSIRGVLLAAGLIELAVWIAIRDGLLIGSVRLLIQL
jgi:hypothetical protein